jgi:DNA invertase Pin-like site-specific DNA recombinase
MVNDLRVPAAQYLRMSTEHQQYSLENQSVAIQLYAESHGFEVIQTYSDAAKSGLVLKYRAGLRQLLQDVVSGRATYRAILVYDVSRWGRFQDTDESAHYEFLCKSAGVPVHYCAEQFANDGSLPSLIMKALKRTMAGEYSRELSEKVFAGQKRLTLNGFKTGGTPGYGLRRMLVSASGVRKQQLAFGERKSIATDRVILVPGPSDEVQSVRDMYRMHIEEKRSCAAIARILNKKGVPFPGHAKWTYYHVGTILTHPKYAGFAVFGRISKKLHTPEVKMPQSEWIMKAGAFDPIVDPATFQASLKAYQDHKYKKTDQEMLDDLRQLLAAHGRLSYTMVKNAPGFMVPRTYYQRFGTLKNAFRLVGYDNPRNFEIARSRNHTRTLRDELMQRIVATFPNEVSIVRRSGRWRSRLLLYKRFMVSVLISRTDRVWKDTRNWVIEPVSRERRFPTLVARLDKSNQTIMDMYVFPKIDRPRKFDLSDSWLARGKRLTELSQFLAVVEEVRVLRRLFLGRKLHT